MIGREWGQNLVNGKTDEVGRTRQGEPRGRRTQCGCTSGWGACSRLALPTFRRLCICVSAVRSCTKVRLSGARYQSWDVSVSFFEYNQIFVEFACGQAAWETRIPIGRRVTVRRRIIWEMHFRSPETTTSKLLCISVENVWTLFFEDKLLFFKEWPSTMHVEVRENRPKRSNGVSASHRHEVAILRSSFYKINNQIALSWQHNTCSRDNQFRSKTMMKHFKSMNKFCVCPPTFVPILRVRSADFSRFLYFLAAKTLKSIWFTGRYAEAIIQIGPSAGLDGDTRSLAERDDKRRLWDMIHTSCRCSGYLLAPMSVYGGQCLPRQMIYEWKCKPGRTRNLVCEWLTMRLADTPWLPTH